MSAVSVNVISNFFQPWEIKKFRRDENIVPVLQKLENKLEEGARLLNWSEHESEEVSTLFELSGNVILRQAMRFNTFGDLRSILNAAHVLTSNFPTELQNELNVPTFTLNYSSSSQWSCSIQFAKQIIPNPLKSDKFIPTLASAVCMSDWIDVIPNYQFSVKNEFNLLRLLYALQRDIYLAYRDEFIIEQDGKFMQNLKFTKKPLLFACSNVFLLQKISTCRMKSELPQRKNIVHKIEPEYLVAAESALTKFLSDEKVGNLAIQKFKFSNFEKLTPEVIGFLPTCLVMLEPVVKISKYRPSIESDLAEFRIKATGSDTDLYSFKARKLESALIALDRLYSFGNELLNPSN